MNYNLLLDNLTNPALLFFVLGIVAVYLKSDLEIPDNSSKFISLYFFLKDISKSCYNFFEVLLSIVKIIF